MRMVTYVDGSNTCVEFEYENAKEELKHTLEKEMERRGRSPQWRMLKNKLKYIK